MFVFHTDVAYKCGREGGSPLRHIPYVFSLACKVMCEKSKLLYVALAKVNYQFSTEEIVTRITISLRLESSDWYLISSLVNF